MADVVVQALADAFMEVGVFVAVTVALFAWLHQRLGDRLPALLRRGTAVGPLVGALLGVTPGCGAAIVLMPLYVRGTVSFGTVVAALVATMGDASFVIIAADPVLALQLHAMLFGAGLVTGYLVDAWSRWRGTGAARPGSPSTVRPDAGTPEAAGALGAHRCSPAATGLGPLRRLDAVAAPVLWSVTWPAFLLALPLVLHAADPAALTSSLGGVDPYLVLGVTGAVLAIAWTLSRPDPVLGDPGHPTCTAGRRGLLAHSAHEAAFVTTWVAVAYVAWELVAAWSGFDGSHLVVAGVAGVLVGAAVGLVPGCALQITFTGLHVAGGVPLPALVANAVSQDGDALLPLLARAPGAAVRASLLTTVPAVLLGLGALWLL